MRINILSLVALAAVGVVHGQDKNDQVGGLSGTINTPSPAIVLGVQGTFTYTVSMSAVQSLSLVLCQSSLNAQDNTKRDIKPLVIENLCVNGAPSGGTPCTATAVNVNEQITQLYTVDADQSLLASPSSTTFYFLCLAPTGGDCGPHSPAFNINGISTLSLDQAQIPQAPISLLYNEPPSISLAPTGSVTMTTPPISSMNQAATTTTFTSYGVTVTTPTAVAPTDPATANDDSVQTSKSSSGLSIGAKVGIAIAAAAGLIIVLLLILLFLRRKHRQRGAAGQVMLNQSLNADSRDLITEKEISAGSLNSPAPTFSTIPSTSHARNNSLTPYEPAPSRPYAGLAAAVPRRSPTVSAFPSTVTGAATTKETGTGVAGEMAAATAAGTTGAAAAAAATTTTSRGVSIASSAIISPRSTTASLLEDSNFEEFRDVAVYGDARHSPQVYPGENGSQQATHLGQSSDYPTYAAASAEDEAARLKEEEEERRIDAAIAEADRAAQYRMI